MPENIPKPRRSRQAKIEAVVESIFDEAEVKFRAVAETLRSQLVVPICKRRGLEFYSGNNDYFFVGQHRGHAVHWSCASLDDEIPADVRRVMRLLDIEVRHAVHLGFYVSHVTAADVAGEAKPS